MRSFKLAAVLPALLLSTSCFAAPPSTESVDKLLNAINAQAMLNAIGNSMQKSMPAVLDQMLASYHLPRDQVAQARQVMYPVVQRDMQDYLHENLNWARLEPLVRAAYVQNFTQEEVDGMLAFYQSPVGISVMKKMPAVAAQSSETVMRQLGPTQQAFQQKISHDIDQAMQDYQQKKAAPASPDSANSPAAQ